MALSSLPRRLSSLHFGSASDIDSLRRFYLCQDLKRSDPRFFDEFLRRYQSFNISGSRMIFPLKLKHQIYYEKEKSLKGVVRYRALPIYLLAMAASRNRNNQVLVDRIRSYIKTYNQDYSLALQKFQEDERSLEQTRTETARSRLLVQHSKDIR